MLLKSMINEQNLANKKMASKQLRLKKQTENILKTVEEAKVCKPAPPSKPREQEPDLVSEFKSMVTGTYA